MSIINDDPAAQAAADESRGVEPVINSNPFSITVRKEENNGPSMPEGGLKPLSEPTQINIDEALADDTPGTATFEGPKPVQDLSDFGSDFIEAPVDSESEESPMETAEEKPAGKSIDIVDKTPEAEDLINGNANEETETAIEETENKEEVEEKKVEPIAPIQHNSEPVNINIDAEHAYEESNEDFFRATREKIANLRKERNECIVSADKKEDELTNIERYNSQYEIAGAFDKIDRAGVENLRNEIRDIRAQADAKDKAIRSALKIIRTM